MRQRRSIDGRQGLELNEQNLQILVETIPALMWRARPDGYVGYVNKRLLEYFGVPLEEIIGWGWLTKVRTGDRAFRVQSWLGNLNEYPVGSSNAKREGHRATLATPLLREGMRCRLMLLEGRL